MWDLNDINAPEPEAVQAEREIVEEIVRNERPRVQTLPDNIPAEHLDEGAHGCDRCHRVTDLYHNDRTGLSLCERCDVAADAAPVDQVVTFKRLRNGSWGITGTSALLRTGELVNVTKRSGEVTLVRVGKVVWHGDGRAIAATRRA